MKRILLFICAAVSTFAAGAKDGYKIVLNMPGVKDSMVYLAHYYGKTLPTIYKTDSAYFKNGVATLHSNTAEIGGIYIMLLSDKQTYFEFLLNNGDDMTIDADSKNLPTGLAFKNSPENDRFVDYIKFLKSFGTRQQGFANEMKTAKSKDDSTKVRDKMTAAGKELISYRRNYVQQHPKTLLASIFNALEIPQVPEGVHKLPDGKVDSNYAYNYYKSHYWDKFDFTDDRLIQTPIYDAKLDEYFNKLVLPVPDSMEKEADTLLARTRGHKELFKYTLWWTTRNVETSKIMGMDQAFVYMVETYYTRGDAYWLDDTSLQKYTDRVMKIAPNIIGNPAPEINMQDVNGKPVPLSSVKAKYTVIIFWEPSCGHCQHEIPLLDSVYRANLKARGVKIYSVRTDDPVEQWQKFIKEHKIEDWINVYDPNHQSDYRGKYDVYSTPTIYLLDEKHIIRGKRLDHTNITEVIDMLERKAKNQAAAGNKS